MHTLTRADEVEEVLKSVEKRIGQESLMQRLTRGGTLLTSWQALSGPDILQVAYTYICILHLPTEMCANRCARMLRRNGWVMCVCCRGWRKG
jgi:hypothetical protein